MCLLFKRYRKNILNLLISSKSIVTICGKWFYDILVPKSLAKIGDVIMRFGSFLSKEINLKIF